MRRQLATAWWLVAVQGLLLVAVSGALLLLFSQVSAAELAGCVAAAGPSEAPFLLSPARYDLLRLGLASGGGLGLLALGLALTQRRGPVRQPVLSEAPRAAPRRRRWGIGAPSLVALTPGQARLARLLVAGVAGLHLWFAGYDPLSLDEAISYTWFMAPGPAVAASYYPFPNNHVLLSVLGAALHHLVPALSPLVVLRLVPTLTGLAVLGASYWLLLSGLRFGPATVAWLLIQLSPPLVVAAVAGRGYGVAFAALVAGLLATMQLLRAGELGSRARRAAWVGFGGSGVVGLYAVPTHLYGLLGLLVGLAIGFGRLGGRRARRQLLHLAIVSAGLGAVVALLYLPVITVTSWAALVHNPYVQPVPRAAWWPQLTGAYFPGVAGVLLGWPAVSGALFGLVALGAPWLLVQRRLPPPSRRLGWLAYGQLVGWLGLMQVQRVLPPPRTLLAVLLSFFLLLLLGAQWGGATWPLSRRAKHYGFALSLLLVSAAGAYRLGHYVRATAQARRQSLVSFRQVHGWLRAHHPRVVWVDQLPLAVYLRYEAVRVGQPPLPVKLVSDLPPTARLRPAEYLLVLSLPADQRVAYRVGQVAIVAGTKPAEVGPAAAPVAGERRKRRTLAPR